MPQHRTFVDRACVQCNRPRRVRADSKALRCEPCSRLARRRTPGRNETVCLRCGATVYAPPSEVALGKGSYCSRDCRFGPPEDRFLALVEQLPEGCWRWLGRSRSGEGYGRFSLGGKQILAHRAAWLLFIGAIPAGLMVRHRCPGGGRPWCVNPDHLLLGTNSDNMRDMLEDGRHWAQTGLILQLPAELRLRLLARSEAEGLTIHALVVSLLESAT